MACLLSVGTTRRLAELMGAATPARTSRSALLIAAYEYQDPKLARLRAPPHDVEALGRVLADPRIGGYEVRTLVNEPHWAVLEEIEAFFADRKPDDLLLLYFSCHGVKDVTGRLYFAARSTNLSRLGSTALSSAWINEQLERSRSKRLVVLLDCCYSGAFAKGLAPRSGPSVVIDDSLGGRGRAIIAASDAMEYAWEDDELSLDEGQPSLFTRALVAGLETGDADRDGDGVVSVEELYDYVYDKVRQLTSHQTPTKSSHGEQGDLILARNPRPRVPTPQFQQEPLPLELDSALHDRRVWIRRAAISELALLLSGNHPGLAPSAERALRDLASHDDDPDVKSAAEAALAIPIHQGRASLPDSEKAPSKPAELAETVVEREPLTASDATPASHGGATSSAGDGLLTTVSRFLMHRTRRYSTASMLLGMLALVPLLAFMAGPLAILLARAAKRRDEVWARGAVAVAILATIGGFAISVIWLSAP
jgi:hypothetical protein